MHLAGKEWPEIYKRCVPDLTYYELDLGLDQRQARGRQTQDKVRLRNAVGLRLRRLRRPCSRYWSRACSGTAGND